MKNSKLLVSSVIIGMSIGHSYLAHACDELPSLIDQIMKKSPSLLASAEGVRSAESRLELSKSGWRPQLSLFAKTAAGDSGFSQIQVENSTGVRVSQRLYDFGKSKLQKQSAGFRLAEATARQNAVYEQETLLVTIAYIDGLEARAMINALNEREKYLLDRVRSLQTMLDNNAATLAELAEAKAEYSLAHADVMSALYSLENAMARLKSRALFRPKLCTLEKVEVWLRPMQTISVQPEKLVQIAIKRDPLLSAELASADMLSIEANVEKRSRLPVIEVAGTSSYAYDRFNQDWRLRSQVGIEVNVPLVTGGRIKASHGIARAEARAAKFRASEMVRAVRQDVLSTSSRLDTLSREMKARGQVTIAVQQQFDAAKVEYELGAKTFSELVDVRVSLDQAIVSEIKVKHEYTRQLAILINWTSGLRANTYN